jgi:hypothetical protein
MARKVNSLIPNDAAKYFAVAWQGSDSRKEAEFMDAMMKEISEAIELYLEALTAQEKENRLSR